MKFRLNIFWKEALLFGTTMALGLVVAFRYAALTSSAPIFQSPSWSLGDFIQIALIIAFILVVTRMPRAGKVVLWVFLVLLIFSGTDVVLGCFLLSPYDLIGALVVLALFFAWRNVLTHDTAIILSLTGICAALGTGITPTVAIVLLIILSFYDIIAVYKTKHMVRLAEGMVQSGAIFGFIIPSDMSSFFTHRTKATANIGKSESAGEQFMILGSGDIGLPLIFAASLMRQSVAEAIIVAIFALIGVLVTHLLFMNQPKRQAMAALPPIATMCLIGYILALVLKF